MACGSVLGWGVVAPSGLGTQQHLRGLVRGRSLVRSLAGPAYAGNRHAMGAAVAGLPPGPSGEPRYVTLGAAAVDQAVRAAGLDGTAALRRAALVVGTAVGATGEMVEMVRGGRPFRRDAFDLDLLERVLAARLGVEGPTATVTTGCTAGVDAVGHGLALLDAPGVDLVVVVAADAPLNPLVVAAFEKISALSSRTDEPEAASRPFDAGRDGFCLGEGAAAFVLARRHRGGPRLRGYATVSSAHHMTGIRQDGRDIARAVTVALAHARVGPADVGLVDSHGTSTRQNDHAEARGLAAALGGRTPPVLAQKSVNGHALGASNAVELAGLLGALGAGRLPPAANTTDLDEEVDLVRAERGFGGEVALKLSSGFGGIHSALVVERAA